MKLIAWSLSVLCLTVFAIALRWPIRNLPPQLIDHCGDLGDPRSAPIVVVGVVQSDLVVLRPVPMHTAQKTPLQMRRMHVAIENVMRGDVKSEGLEIYYFTWAGGFDGPQPLGMRNVGSRRILWLRRDAGVLRTACDGWDRCTWGVYSGSHRDLKLKPGGPIERALADIVLTRGEGPINEARFAGSIVRGAPVPDEYQIENYRHLAITERAGGEAAACEALWIASHDPKLRGTVGAEMEQAHCVCRVVEHGEPDCGLKGYAHDDPPF